VVAVPVAQFAVIGLAAVIIVGLATATASRRVGQREAISDVRTTTLIKAQGLVEPAVTNGLAGSDPAAVAAVAIVVERSVIDASLVRVKVWNAGGTIVYSNARPLQGATYPLGQDELASLHDGLIQADVSDLSRPENRFERDFGELLEVYLPIRTPDGQRLLFEAYYRYDAVSAAGRRIWGSFAPVALGALIALELLQIPLAWSLAGRLRQRQRERERLLQHAIEASDIERRRIASDLQDGVVQDLVGVSFALAGAARDKALPPGAARQLSDASESLRSSVSALRSTLADIYPRDLADLGLPGGLDALAGDASSGELEVRVEASDVPGTLARPVALLLYRAAREALRNVGRHAGLNRRHQGRCRPVRGVAVGHRRWCWLRHRHFAAPGGRWPPRAAGFGGRRSRRRRHPAGRVAARAGDDGVRRGADFMTLMTRVVVVDDHAIVRDGIGRLLDSAPDIEVVATAADGAEAIAAVATARPEVVLMDLSMPGVDGVEATRQLTAGYPDVKVLVLTTFADQRRILDALDAGAAGYLLKDADPDAVINAIRAVVAGGAPLDPKAARVLLDSRQTPAPARRLSNRELEVLSLLATGLANKQIARCLGIAERTVKAHLTSIFQQLGVTDRTQAALWAATHLPDQ
jgi:DNA-binding NarL/FixJ family response regulator/signal transduction histidine kinase